MVLHQGRDSSLTEVAASLADSFADVHDTEGQPQLVSIRAGTGTVHVAETEVVLHRAARHYTGERTASGYKKQVEVPGPPLPLRLVVTRVVDKAGKAARRVVAADECRGRRCRRGDDRPMVRVAVVNRVLS